MRRLTLLIVLLALTAVAAAQGREKERPAAPDKAAATTSKQNPLSDWNRHAFGVVKDILLRAAEKVPESDYGFQPTESVRSYGQIVGHVADSQYYFCATALGEPYTSRKVEKTKTSKSELIAALKESFAYCDKAYEGMTDASGTQIVKLFGNEDTPKLSVLNVNEMHDMEHYGNLVTYMRMKNIVPPTSEPQAQK